jgi:hypothetical protein
MRTAIFVCYIAICLLFATSVRSRVTAADHDRLDSLLLTGNPQAAMDYWSIVCAPETEDTLAAPCQSTTELLQDLLDFVAVFENQKPAYTGEVIADGRTQSAKYNESYAGPSAARAFQSFVSAADGNDWLKAIVYLRTARLFKISFMTRTLADAHSYYVQADRYFDEGEYDSADSLLNSINYDAGNHPALLAYADTISYLQKRVDRKLLEIEKKQYYWERTDAVNSRFSFSLTGQLLNHGGSNAFPLVMSSTESTIRVEITRMPRSFRPGLGLQAWYQLNERTAVGAGVAATTFIYSSVHTPQLIFFEFDVSYIRLFLGGQYMLRSAVGLRPYLSLGLGVMRYKYDQIECVVLQPPSESVTYQVDAGTFSNGEVTITYGTQFVPNHDSRWGITSEMSWHTQFKTHAFLPPPRLSMAMRIDLLM